MDSDGFLRVVGSAFTPFLTDLGFRLETPSISGRHYRADFGRLDHVVSISFEPGDNALFVFVFRRVAGGLSDIDDTDQTPRLADLNRRFSSSVTAADRARVDKELSTVVARDDGERALVKAARDLRLVLPKYLDFSQT